MIAFMIDGAFIFLCGLTTWLLLSRAYQGPVLSLPASLELAAFFWLVLATFALLIGVYRQTFLTKSNYQFLLASKSYVYAAATIMASFFLLKLHFVPRSFFALFLILTPVHFMVGRAVLSALNSIFQRFGLGIHNTILVTNGSDTKDIASKYSWFPELGYDIKGFLIGITDGNTNDDTGIPLYELSQLATTIKREGVDRIFIPSQSFVVNGFSELIGICEKQGVKLRIISPETSRLLRMARVYDVAGITLSSPTRRRVEAAKGFLKRIVDIVGSTLVLAVLSPLFLITSLAIWIESGRPVIYGQRRSATRNGKEIKFFKFRSMRQSADAERDGLLSRNESSGPLFKMKNDPRVTRVGRIIRKYSIDELPQLFNVLIGDMSLVGPRPLPIEDFERVDMEEGFWQAIRDRERVKPGMTGLWQVSGRSEIEFNEMVLLDLYYAEHNTLLMDLEILFETIPAVLFGKGAY